MYFITKLHKHRHVSRSPDKSILVGKVKSIVPLLELRCHIRSVNYIKEYWKGIRRQ